MWGVNVGASIYGTEYIYRYISTMWGVNTREEQVDCFYIKAMY